MLQKFLSILTKIIFGIFIFYLILGFVVIPLLLGWVITDQGTKYLKHPVRLSSVRLNPLSFELSLKDFKILDNQGQLMMGFDKLWLKINVFDFLKKIYHVKHFEVDGFKINVELVTQNKINLLELIPQLPDQAIKPKQSNQVAVNQSIKLPSVIIDEVVLHQGQVHFTDLTINPHFSTTLSAIELLVTNVSTDPQAQAKIKFHAHLGDRGRISMETIIKPLSIPLEIETTMSLNDYTLEVLTPYVGKYTGRELKDGKLDLKMDYRIEGNKLMASHKFLIQRFEFGNPVQSPDALHLPFGLAVALLEDSSGKINIALPVTGDMSDPKFEYLHLIGQVARNFFLKLITKPFSFLGSMLDASDSGTDELGYVRFPPGMAVLSVSQQHRLLTLMKGLQEHPKLRLEIKGSYDPQADWKKIQADVFVHDYEQLRKESSRTETKLYQLLYQRRFGIRALWALAKKYKRGMGDYDESKLDDEIKRQLIENAPPDKIALSALAESRAQLVNKFLIFNGFDPQHMEIGRPESTEESMGYVPLEFTLTVFDKK